MLEKSVVAIDTVPLPESPAFRFDRFLVDKLVDTKAIDGKAEPLTRFGLALEALREAEQVGYIVDYPHVCFSDNPPEWCKYAGGVTTEGRVLLIDSLLANGGINNSAWSSWRAVAAKLDLASLAPRLFQEIGMKAERSLEILDKAAVAGAAMPVPGSELDRFCREHPEAPICQLALQPFESIRARRLASELVMVSMLHQDGLIQDEQAATIYNGYYNDLSPGLALRDISIYSGVIVTDGLVLDAKAKAEISLAIGSRLGTVGSFGPDSPWADICFGPNPPRICWVISQFPAAAALVTELVNREVWSKKDALQAWSEAAGAILREPFPMKATGDRRLEKPAAGKGDAAIRETEQVP